MTVTYLDHAASTPMRPEAIEAMLPFLDGSYANPSGSHRFARQARKAVDESRDRIADVLGCRPNEVVFTGCGTESDNMAVGGAVAAARLAGRAGVAVCPAAEHHAVLDVVEHGGGEVVGVDGIGHVDIDELAGVLDRLDASGRPADVVSVMTVNNEVGTVTDIGAVAAVVRRHAPDAWLHTDAVQAPSWVDLRHITPSVDLLALSAHKFGGPKGVGVLVERGRAAEHRVAPLIIGGGQERERRSGTHNVAGIVAMTEAMVRTDVERDDECRRIAALRDQLVDRLCADLDDVVETVPRDRKVAGNAHVCIAGIESEALLFLLDEADVCASAASACASGAMEPSHVLAAMGVDRSLALGALRLSVGHASTQADVDRAVHVVVDAVTRLRR
ncbi:MAG: cysteine desulfurase family protein [Actinomycetota bacterium]